MNQPTSYLTGMWDVECRHFIVLDFKNLLIHFSRFESINAFRLIFLFVSLSKS